MKGAVDQMKATTTASAGTNIQIEIRRASERFHTQTDWLDSYHSFSFGPHFDPDNVGFGTLRVLNDDIIAPGRGFGAHPHRDMEIVTWVVKGAVAHKDSSGGEGVIRPGEAQAMSAGTGVVHSEFNASATEPAHFLQMWVEPAQRGLTPSYAQRSFPVEARRGRLLPIVSGRPIEGTLRIRQEATMFVGSLEVGQSVTHQPSIGERTHLYVISGAVQLGGETLHAGDAARITGRESVTLKAKEGTELVVWDLA
jgi:quercetin 2,3-dioxygenase